MKRIHNSGIEFPFHHFPISGTGTYSINKVEIYLFRSLATLLVFDNPNDNIPCSSSLRLSLQRNRVDEHANVCSDYE